MAFLASRKVREGLCALAGFAGVLLISGPGGHFSAVRYAFGLGAAAFSALFGAGSVGEVSGRQRMVLAVAAAVGVAIPYAVDTIAARVSSARVVGTLFGVDPVVGSLVGGFVLGEHIGGLAVAGILVAAVGAAVVWISEPKVGPLPEEFRIDEAAAPRT